MSKIEYEKVGDYYLPNIKRVDNPGEDLSGLGNMDDCDMSILKNIS